MKEGKTHHAHEAKDETAGPPAADLLPLRPGTAPRTGEAFWGPATVADGLLSHNAIDALPLHIAILEATGRIIGVNRAWRAFAEANHPRPGSVCEGADYLAACEAAQGEDAAVAGELARAVRAALRGEGEHPAIEYPCHSPGQKRWFVVHVCRFVDAGGIRVVVAHEEVTQRTLAEQRLRESEERYRTLFSSSLDAVLLTSPDGRMLAANEAACRMFDRTEDELRAIGRSGVVDPTDTRLAAALEERKRTGHFRGELTLMRKDGSRFPGEISSAVFTLHGGEARTSMVIRDVSAQRRAEQELRTSQDQLRALTAQLESAREEERVRVAREIHDVLAQELTRLKIDLSWLHQRLDGPARPYDRETLAARVAETMQATDAAIVSVQRIATSLRPAVLDALGLCATVEWQVRDFQEHTGIPSKVSVPDRDLPEMGERATATFRILQESLTNVARHAKATRVDVRLWWEAGQIVLRVCDDGCGIPPESLSSPVSIGLAGMRERALLLGGHLVITSRPGAGTTIEARLPVPDNTSEEPR